jgi:hypothetical protein
MELAAALAAVREDLFLRTKEGDYLGLGEVFKRVVDFSFDQLEFDEHELVIDLSDFLEERFEDVKTFLVVFLI